MGERLPEVGTVWRRRKGKERARVDRVWSSEHFCGGGTFVRCQPLHGGKWWTAHVEDFLERFKQVDADA